MTVYENIKFVLGGQQFSRKQIKEKFFEVTRKVHLDTLLDRYPHQLSGGEQQRLAIARAICTNPDFLLMDEPFCNLDMYLKKELMDTILSLKEENHMTLVYVTHSMEEAFYMSDQVVVMNAGEVVWSGMTTEMEKRGLSDTVNFFKGEK